MAQIFCKLEKEATTFRSYFRIKAWFTANDGSFVKN